jgi:signal transduction histidine kinase
MNITYTKLEHIKSFLIKNADAIQKRATKEHKLHLGGKKFRSELIKKYQNYHIKTVEEFAHYLDAKHLKKGSTVFKELGDKLARDAATDGLTIEETLDGTIFLKQAIWHKLNDAGLIEELTTCEYHELNMLVGTFIDILASKIAFTFHTERQQIERNLKYLAEASQILSSSLDYEQTLNSIARLAVPHIADWCSIELVTSEEILDQIVVAHKDPKKVKWAKELRKKYPPDMNAPQGMPNVIRTGKSELFADITDEMLVALAKDKKHLKLMRSIGFTSALIVPLKIQKKVIGCIGFITTEARRHYNQSDVAIAEELANRASIAIDNAQLYSNSQKAIGLRDEFISVASHELKTPVTSVKMFTQVLKQHSEQIGDTKAIQHLSTMDKQLNKLTELIYDLLNVSKIQAGRMEFNLKSFDFDAHIYEIVNVLQQSSRKHKIIIEGSTHKKVRGDEERLGQVINNLVSNAIKYSPKSSKILIKLRSDKHSVTVAVQDFGIGMEKEHLAKIFERFYRVYDTTDKTFPGLGIGLYISSEIIKRHGGRLWVESDKGKGSTFYFTLPINGKKENAKK